MNISIVIPVYNEVENLPILHQAIHQALDAFPDWCWEMVLVDDGSSDGSVNVLENLAASDPEHVCMVALRRNFGQTAAIAAGIDHAQGDVIVLMDADLQNDPADIPMMMEKINEGYDVVSGWRVNRQDAFVTRILPSRSANWLISTVTGVHLHDYGCTLKAYRREVLTGFRLYGEMHRFIPAYASLVGANMVEMPVHHHARKYGKTKYGLTRTLKVVLDLFTVKFLLSYAYKPIYLFGGAGLLMIFASAAAFLFLILRKFTLHIDILSSPLFQISTMFFILGFQSILMGLIAELLVRTYHESQQKTTYTIRKVIRRGSRGKMSVPSGKAKDRSTALRWFGTLVTLALLLYVLGKYRVDIWVAFRQIPPWRLVLGLGLMMVSRLAVVARWYVLLRSGGVNMTPGECTRITFAGLFSNNFLPTTVGGDVVRLAGAVQLHYDAAICTASLIVDRLVGMAGMAMALPFGLPRFLQSQSLSSGQAGATPRFLMGIGLLAMGNLWERAWSKGLDLARRIMNALALWLKQPRALLLALACSWVNMLCLFSFLYLMFDSMGEPLPFWLIAGLYSLVYFVTLIPISINGYGLQEVSMTLVFSRFGGASVVNGVTAALLFRTLMMLTSLPGAAFLPGILAGGRAEDKPSQL